MRTHTHTQTDTHVFVSSVPASVVCLYKTHQ